MPLTSHPITQPFLPRTVISSYTRSNRCFSRTKPHGRREIATHSSTSLWEATMEQKHASSVVGCYLLSQLTQIPEINIGLYRDDGLAVLNQTPQKIEKVKKEICKIFANNNLRITIEANKKIVNFLDVTLDLTTERFKPYSKPATNPSLCAQQVKPPT